MKCWPAYSRSCIISFPGPCGIKKRYYFTALNEQSLALAKSIVTDPQEKHVQLIFTDAYSDKEEEKSTELLLSAKALGAICLKDDLLHISLITSEKNRTHIFLSDGNENENLQTLSRLLAEDVQKRLRNTVISVFGTDKKMSYVEDEVLYIHNRLSAQYEAKGEKIEPDVVPINGIRNMAQKLFYELPLFEGLYGKPEGDRQLNLTIIGSGVIGTEMFLNALWFGQIAGVELNINIVSMKESEQKFISRINNINPDIMASARAGDPILDARIGDGPENWYPAPQPRYFHFRYHHGDVMRCDINRLLEKKLGDDGFRLRDTDYFIVAAGSDEDNFLIADKLRQAVGAYHLDHAREQKTIISYVIYNSDLCRTLNARARMNHIAGANPYEFDVYMHPFGSMEEIYSVENILRNAVRPFGEMIDQQYKKQTEEPKPEETAGKTDEEIEAERKEKEKEKKEEESIYRQIRNRRYYNQRANDSRAMQLSYKIYAAGLLPPTLFLTRSDEEYRVVLMNARFRFSEAVHQTWSYPENADRFHALAWMEHRRWNAFMRINGFRRPENIDNYINLNSDIHESGKKGYQFLFIKLHPCVVEVDLSGFPGVKCENETRTRGRDKARELEPDELDLLARRTGSDYKSYDYPEKYVPEYDCPEEYMTVPEHILIPKNDS